MTSPIDPTDPSQPTRPVAPPPWATAPPVTPAPKQRSWFARHKILTGVLAVVGLLVVLGGIGAAVGGGSNSSGKKPVAAATTQDTTEGTALDPSYTPPSSAPPAEESSEYGQPKASDFKLTIKTTSKQCFGTAGCLVEYKVTAAYSGPDLDPDKSYDVTYHVAGPQDGGQDDTFVVTGDDYEVPQGQSAQTPSSSTKLTVKVTDVSES